MRSTFWIGRVLRSTVAWSGRLRGTPSSRMSTWVEDDPRMLTDVSEPGPPLSLIRTSGRIRRTSATLSAPSLAISSAVITLTEAGVVDGSCGRLPATSTSGSSKVGGVGAAGAAGALGGGGGDAGSAGAVGGNAGVAGAAGGAAGGGAAGGGSGAAGGVWVRPGRPATRVKIRAKSGASSVQEADRAEIPWGSRAMGPSLRLRCHAKKTGPRKRHGDHSGARPQAYFPFSRRPPYAIGWAGFLAPDPRCSPPSRSSQWRSGEQLPVTVAGPRRLCSSARGRGPRTAVTV